MLGSCILALAIRKVGFHDNRNQRIEIILHGPRGMCAVSTLAESQRIFCQKPEPGQQDLHTARA